jgi:zinc protease
MAYRVMPALLYGENHPYGNPFTGSGTSASVSKMTRADLVKFHDTWFRPNNSTMIVVGDTTMEQIKPKLERLFAGWKSGDVPKKNVTSVAMASKSEVYLIDKPGALQSVIVAGIVAFGARINMNLREDKHWSYGARTVLRDARSQRPYLAIAPVQTDKTKESLEEMNKEFRGIVGDHPVGDAELKKIQANETLKVPGSRETLDALEQGVADIVQFGLPDDYYQTYGSKVSALQLSDVNGAAKQIVHPDNLIWVVVGDRAKIESGVKELNLGEFHLMSADGKVM